MCSCRASVGLPQSFRSTSGKLDPGHVWQTSQYQAELAHCLPGRQPWASKPPEHLLVSQAQRSLGHSRRLHLKLLVSVGRALLLTGPSKGLTGKPLNSQALHDLGKPDMFIICAGMHAHPSDSHHLHLPWWPDCHFHQCLPAHGRFLAAIVCNSSDVDALQASQVNSAHHAAMVAFGRSTSRCHAVMLQSEKLALAA